jgi:transcriptional regulator with XRE-family HTH domain
VNVFGDLGPALRWLRLNADLRQSEVAHRAGITRAMLSAYETQKQSPSLDSLDRILGALHANLLTLHRALAHEGAEVDSARGSRHPYALFDSSCQAEAPRLHDSSGRDRLAFDEIEQATTMFVNALVRLCRRD